MKSFAIVNNKAIKARLMAEDQLGNDAGCIGGVYCDQVQILP